jgi:hypothetical protein
MQPIAADAALNQFRWLIKRLHDEEAAAPTVIPLQSVA